jgi:hypothetical protein
MRFVIAAAALCAFAAVALVGAATPGFAANSSAWKLYNYNPSGQALSSTQVTGSTTAAASFDFQQNIYTAQLLTSAKASTGDLTGGTMNATLSVSGVTGTFQDQNGGGCTPDNQTVRFFFSTPGFAFTHFWWSNPVAMTLNTTSTQALSVALNDPSQWSDWNGQNGSTVPAAFSDAVSKVDQAGVSFGGGCFFENGVTTSDGSGTFALTAFSD